MSSEFNANKRYETMISELKRLHSEYIFLMKIKGYDLDRIQFEYDDEYMAVFVFKKTIPDEDKPSIKSVCFSHNYQLFHRIDMHLYEDRVHNSSEKLQEMYFYDYAKNNDREMWDAKHQPELVGETPEYLKKLKKEDEEIKERLAKSNR